MQRGRAYHRHFDPHAIVLGNPLWHPYYWTDKQSNMYKSLYNADRAHLQPIYFPAGMTISQMTCHIDTAGGAGTSLRLGLYADNGGTPVGGALLYDSGNLNANVANTPINAPIVPALVRPKGVSTWAALITDSAILQPLICDWLRGFVEIGAEFMNGCYYAQVFGPFADPCPAVVSNSLTRFWGFVRVDSVQAL